MRCMASHRGRRWLTVGLGLVTIATAVWYLPPSADRTVRPVHVATRSWVGPEPEGLTIFRTADELREALPSIDDERLPTVNWDSTNLVRVRCRAPGYMTDGDSEPRYGIVAHCSRLGGAQTYFYFDEPTPYWLWGNVRSVFIQIFREEWFAVPKGTSLHWEDNGTKDLIGLGLVLSIGLLIFARVRIVRGHRGSLCNTNITQMTLGVGPAATFSSG